MSRHRSEVGVRPIEPGDGRAWRALYRGYASFYEQPVTDSQLDRVWDWLLDPRHESTGLVAVRGDRVVGLAHYRQFARPLSASVGGFLDDLFVAPDSRGHGAARAMLGELDKIAADHGWSVVRWITAEKNHRARTLYDQLATRTAWVTYDLAPGVHGAASGSRDSRRLTQAELVVEHDVEVGDDGG